MTSGAGLARGRSKAVGRSRGPQARTALRIQPDAATLPNHHYQLRRDRAMRDRLAELVAAWPAPPDAVETLLLAFEARGCSYNPHEVDTDVSLDDLPSTRRRWRDEWGGRPEADDA